MNIRSGATYNTVRIDKSHKPVSRTFASNITGNIYLSRHKKKRKHSTADSCVGIEHPRFFFLLKASYNGVLFFQPLSRSVDQNMHSTTMMALTSGWQASGYIYVFLVWCIDCCPRRILFYHFSIMFSHGRVVDLVILNKVSDMYDGWRGCWVLVL